MLDQKAALLVSYIWYCIVGFYYSVAASSWCGVCLTATSVEPNTRAGEFIASRTATTSHSTSTGSSARSNSAILGDGVNMIRSSLQQTCLGTWQFRLNSFSCMRDKSLLLIQSGSDCLYNYWSHGSGHGVQNVWACIRVKFMSLWWTCLKAIVRRWEKSFV